MELIIKIVQFFLCFTILVGLHELGHFLMARLFKIRVEKFYIFFDPWFSLFKFRRGNTEYGLGWIPLGGYVKIAGMVDESMDKEQLKQAPKSDEFRSKPAWQRFLVLIAGVVMNVVLAVTIYCAVCYVWGDSYFSNQDAKWGYRFNEAGHALGFRDGDRFVSIDGEPVDDIARVVNDLLITENGRTVVVERGGEEIALQLPFEALVEMRRSKGYEGLFMPYQPFIIDSVVRQEVAALRAGDEVIAIDSLHGVDFPAYSAYLKSRAGQDVAVKVLREDDMALDLPLTVDADGRLGVLCRSFALRTQQYTFWQAIPAGFRKTGRVISSYWEQLKLIVRPKTKMYEELGGFIAIGSIFSVFISIGCRSVFLIGYPADILAVGITLLKFSRIIDNQQDVLFTIIARIGFDFARP